MYRTSPHGDTVVARGLEKDYSRVNNLDCESNQTRQFALTNVQGRKKKVFLISSFQKFQSFIPLETCLNPMWHRVDKATDNFLGHGLPCSYWHFKIASSQFLIFLLPKAVDKVVKGSSEADVLYVCICLGFN